MKQIGYYPGCSQLSTARDYNESLQAVTGRLGWELIEIPEWNCCGASPAHSVNEELALALPFRNLLKAQAAGLKKILAVCPACYSRLAVTQKEIEEKPRARARVEEIVGGTLKERIEVIHLLQFFRDEVGLDAIRQAVTRPLTGLRIGGYYGCLLRLPGSEVDDVEQPKVFEDTIKALGAEPVELPLRIECCGAGLAIPRTDAVVRLASQILDSASVERIDAISVVCGLCQTNLDSRQAAAEKRLGKTFDIPIIYLTQLIGLALGLGEWEIHLGRLLVAPHQLFKKWGAAARTKAGAS